MSKLQSQQTNYYVEGVKQPEDVWVERATDSRGMFIVEVEPGLHRVVIRLKEVILYERDSLLAMEETMGIRWKLLVAFAAIGVVYLSAAGPVAAPKFSDWSPPALVPNVNSEFVDAGPAISRDGRSLYFNSDRPGGFGSNDIWVSRRARVKDPWGTPVNLGPTINTNAIESAPAFSRDGHWMFFTSTRPGGFGPLLEIWVSWRPRAEIVSVAKRGICSRSRVSRDLAGRTSARWLLLRSLLRNQPRTGRWNGRLPGEAPFAWTWARGGARSQEPTPIRSDSGGRRATRKTPLASAQA
jgi:hypothetical protein